MILRTVIRTDEVVLGAIVSTERAHDEVRVSEDPRSSIKYVYVGSRMAGTLDKMDGPYAEGERYVLTVVPVQEP